MFADWTEWHRHYSDAGLTQRLQLTHDHLHQALAAAPGDATGVVRLVSICAGEGRDVLPVLADQRSQRRVRALLLEQDQTVAAKARSNIAGLGLEDVEVRLADAGALRTFAEIAPIDLLVMSGVFGNITLEDAQQTVAAIPGLLAAGGLILWTRSRSTDGPDRSAELQSSFLERGFAEVSCAITPDGSFRVGIHRLGPDAAPKRTWDGRMFSFRGPDQSDSKN